MFWTWALGYIAYVKSNQADQQKEPFTQKAEHVQRPLVTCKVKIIALK